jgi:hypothetical protein
MDYEKASRDFFRYLPLKIVTFCWFVFALAVGAYGVAATWNEWWPYTFLEVRELDEAKVAIYAFLGGLFGATVFAFRGFYWAVGPQSGDNPRYQYDPNWTWWYFARPLIGPFLGAATYALIRGGVAVFGGTGSSNGTSSVAYFGVAFLAGFSMTEVLDWASSAGKRFFRGE